MAYCRKKSCYAALSLLLASTPVALGQQTSESRGRFAPGDVELSASRVYVHVGKIGFGHEHGVVGRLKSGTVRLGATVNAGQLVFDMASFVADSDDARNYVGLRGRTDAATQSKVSANMVGPHVLDVARFPTAEFAIDSALPLSQPSQRGMPVYEFQGKLALHGASRPVKFWAEVEQRDGWNRLVGRFTLQQTAFGMTPFTTAFGAVGVADQMTVFGDLWIAPETRGAQQPRPAIR